jgi:hypothetical protein
MHQILGICKVDGQNHEEYVYKSQQISNINIRLENKHEWLLIKWIILKQANECKSFEGRNTIFFE